MKNIMKTFQDLHYLKVLVPLEQAVSESMIGIRWLGSGAYSCIFCSLWNFFLGDHFGSLVCLLMGVIVHQVPQEIIDPLICILLGDSRHSRTILFNVQLIEGVELLRFNPTSFAISPYSLLCENGKLVLSAITGLCLFTLVREIYSSSI